MAMGWDDALMFGLPFLGKLFDMGESDEEKMQKQSMQQAQQLQQMQMSRLQQTDPLFRAILQMAMGLMPRAQQGMNVPGMGGPGRMAVPRTGMPRERGVSRLPEY